MPTYVDGERGLVSREIFVDEGVYRLEQERIFCKQWLFIGHESQIPKPGDFFASRMGEGGLAWAETWIRPVPA